MGRKPRTIEELIEELLLHQEVKNENGDVLQNLEDVGRDSDDWVSMSKSDLKELIKNAFVCGVFQN